MAELMLTPKTKVSEIAARYPATLRMMEALGIDYCCGGKRPLAEAAEAAGISPERAVAVLQAAVAQAASTPSAGKDWARAPLDALMAHIVDTHHAYMDAELPRLEGMLALVARVHGPSHGDVLQPLVEQYAALKAELEPHLKKEEDVTFPAVAALASGDSRETAARTIAELGAEHDAAGEVLAAMRQTTNGYEVPGDVCGTYRALYDGLQAMERDIHQHIHLENNILFPRALSAA